MTLKIQQNQDQNRNRLIYSNEKELYRKMKKKMIKKKRQKKYQQINNECNQIEELSILQFRHSFSNSDEKENMVNPAQNKKKRDSRTHSQILEPKLKLINEKRKSVEYEDIIRVKKSQSTFTHEIYDMTKGKKNPMRKLSCKTQNEEEQADFKNNEIQDDQSPYLQLALSSLSKVKQRLRKMEESKQFEVPSISLEIPVDSKEIRPQSIDDW